MVKKLTDTKKYIMIAYILSLTGLIAFYSKSFLLDGINEWYSWVYIPFIAPAGGLLPILWAVYDILIGASFILIILKLDSLEFPKYNYPYLAHMILQFLWCYSVFLQKQLGWGLVIIVPYVILAFRTILIYKSGDPLSGKLNYAAFAFILYMAFVNLALVSENGLTAEVYM